MAQATFERSRPSWGTYGGFILAAIGSSVGLGNVWKFPYEMGIHGGTFLYVYLVCVLIVAFPLMVSELMLGRMGQANPVLGLINIARKERLSSLWQLIGWLGVLGSFMVFSYCSIVASWILFYTMKSISGAFTAVPAEIVQNQFGALLRNTDQMLLWHTVFILMVVLVSSQAVRSGLERAVRWLMPSFFVLLIILAFYTRQLGDHRAALEFMFEFDWRAINAELVVTALTQALFSLSIGIGILIMYGSYLSGKRPLFAGAGTIMVFDSLIAVLMSLVIFSVAFAYGLAPNSGAGLIFETLPVAFSQMTENSLLVSSLFFILLLFAALTSGFALLEPSIALLTRRLNIQRRTAAWLVGAVAWCSGLLSLYSFSTLKFAFYYFGAEKKYGYFDLFSILSIHFILPLTALLTAILVGWRLQRSVLFSSLAEPRLAVFNVWRFCNRYVVPVLISLILIAVVFLPA